MALDRPIFLIGAARSGTKIIGLTLGAHSQIAFWDEPKYVWRHGNHGARHDARAVAEATPDVADAIRWRFERFVRGSGKPRFLEKTPSNCFRVGFMHHIFPDGLFLHVQRDGRDVAASAIRRWCSKPDDRAIARRLRGWEIPLTATHHYLPVILGELIVRRFWPGRGHVWGPRYPGLADDLRKGIDVATLCARQWAESERAAMRGLGLLPASQVFRFRYEEFVRDPGTVLVKILDFAQLPQDGAILRAALDLKQERIGAHKELLPEQLHAVETVCMPVMRELGFAWL